MNVKGGMAYIDFKGIDVYQSGSVVVKGVFNSVKNAYNSGKLVVLHKAEVNHEVINDLIPFSVRKKDENTFVFVVYTTNVSVTSISGRYITVNSLDTVSVAVY